MEQLRMVRESGLYSSYAIKNAVDSKTTRHVDIDLETWAKHSFQKLPNFMNTPWTLVQKVWLWVVKELYRNSKICNQ